MTLSDFCQLEIKRTNGIAEIIIDHTTWNGELKPVRLLGFQSTSPNDFEVYEEGFSYYQQLTKEIEKIKTHQK